MPIIYNTEEDQYSEDVLDVMTKPPSFILRWGTSLFFLVVLLIVVMSVFIRYPDTIKTTIKINSDDSPKPIVCQFSGKINRLLVDNNQIVQKNQPLAFLESLASADDVLSLLVELQLIRSRLNSGANHVLDIKTSATSNFGEIQPAFENFSNAFLRFKAVTSDGLYSKRVFFINKDIENILLQKQQLQNQLNLMNVEYDMAKKEYFIHQKLTIAKVEAEAELRREESKLIAKQYPIQQLKSSILVNGSSYLSKQKELVELENEVKDEKIKFSQALSSILSEIYSWKNKFILSASQDGKVAFVGVPQINKYVNAGDEIFYVYPEISSGFFGEMIISQYNMGKISSGQHVLIKLNSYPYEEYGVLKGVISSISEVPFRDSVFLSRVALQAKTSKLKKAINLKTELSGQAEIITEDASLLKRIYRNMTKLLDK